MKRSDFADYIARAQNDPVRIFICAGPPKCEGEPEPCPWCREIMSDDMSEIEEATEH